MANNELCIVVNHCECGAQMTITASRVEDSGCTGVIECVCEQCGQKVIIIAVVEEVQHG